jgi:hypothetical protein
LILDGTSWTIGTTPVHFLVLTLQVGEIAVPLYWMQLDKLGASSQIERMSFIEEVLTIFDLKGMTLLADREYVGKEWVMFLKDKGIAFVIRQRIGDYKPLIDAIKGKGLSYDQMYTKCLTKSQIISRQVVFEGGVYRFVMMPNPKAGTKDPVIFLLTTLANPLTATTSYAKRWKIECLFKHLKTNGYNLEDLNLKDPGKNTLMFAIVTTAYSLALLEGWKRRKKIPTKIYANESEWPKESIFRVGIAWLTNKCFQFLLFIDHVCLILGGKKMARFKNVQ